MSDLLIIPSATQARCCYHCAAWQSWDTQLVSDRSGAIVGRNPLGQCRAHPPGIDPDTVSGATAAWPVVEADAWCLSFRPRETDGDA